MGLGSPGLEPAGVKVSSVSAEKGCILHLSLTHQFHGKGSSSNESCPCSLCQDTASTGIAVASRKLGELRAPEWTLLVGLSQGHLHPAQAAQALLV